MRMFLESGSIDTLSWILANDIVVYVSFSLMVITTSLAIYMLARILEWSSNKPLLGVMQNSAFSVLLVSVVAAVTMLLLLSVDFIRVFEKLGESILSIVEAADYVRVLDRWTI